MSDHSNSAELRQVVVQICENCIKGASGVCHVPGCLFIRRGIEETPQPLEYMIQPAASAGPPLRVFLNGETVPAGVCILTEDGEVCYLDDTGDCCCYAECDDRVPGELCPDCSYDNRNGNLGPLVEVNLPDYWATVKADQTRRQQQAKGETLI